MFHDGMVFILDTKEEAKALGKMLSAEGILWRGGPDPAYRVYFEGDCTFWFLAKDGFSAYPVVSYMTTKYETKESCLNYARNNGYDPPIEFRTWAPSAVPCTPSSIDDLL